jgi:hypothetical protein
VRTIEMTVGGITPTVVDLAAVFPVRLMPGRHEQPSGVSAERLADVRRVVGGPYRAGAHPVPSSGWDRG